MIVNLLPDVSRTMERISSEYARNIYLLKYCIKHGKNDKVIEYFQAAEKLKIKLDLAMHLITKDIDGALGKRMYIDFQEEALIIDE